MNYIGYWAWNGKTIMNDEFGSMHNAPVVSHFKVLFEHLPRWGEKVTNYQSFYLTNGVIIELRVSRIQNISANYSRKCKVAHSSRSRRGKSINVLSFQSRGQKYIALQIALLHYCSELCDSELILSKEQLMTGAHKIQKTFSEPSVTL
jgi:hypothetical protein